MIVLFAQRFRKNYNRLRPKVRSQCEERLKLFETNSFHPLLDNHPLHGEYAGCRSINITGDYRAIFYRESDTVVRFIVIGTHHELFDS